MRNRGQYEILFFTLMHVTGKTINQLLNEYHVLAVNNQEARNKEIVLMRLQPLNDEEKPPQYTFKEIGEKFGISPATARNAIANVLRKLQWRYREELNHHQEKLIYKKEMEYIIHSTTESHRSKIHAKITELNDAYSSLEC